MDTLDLDGDRIDDVIDGVEDAFALKFAGDELLEVGTVGDLHDRVMARLRSDPGLCATSMAFYRVRRGLFAQGWEGRIGPDTPVPAGPDVRPKRFLGSLSGHSGLRMPHASMAWLGTIGAWLTAATVPLFVLALAVQSGLMGWAGFGLLAVGVALLILDRGRMPKGVVTVGDLTRLVVARNPGSLIAQGAGARAAEVWSSLQQVVAEPAGLPPLEVSRDTTFFRPKRKKTAA